MGYGILKMTQMTINGIVVEIPDLEKTAALCVAMVERLGGRGQHNDEDGRGLQQTDSPAFLELPARVQIGEVVGIETVI